MNKLNISVIIFLVFAVNSASRSQTADEIISKHIEAIGGMDVIKSVKTLKLTGTVAVSGLTLDLEITFKRKQKVRIEAKFQDMIQTQGYDGKTAWQIDMSSTTATPHKITDDEAENLKTTADFEGLMINYEKKGYTAALVGKETIDSSETYKIGLAGKSGDSVYYYVDTKSFLVLKRVRVSGDNTTETKFKDYRNYSGLLLPAVLESIHGDSGQFQLIKFDKAEINLKVDDSIFKMPEQNEK